MKDQLANLLEQEMDRGQFLRYVAVGAMMFMGGNAILQALSSVGAKKSSTVGYGASSYGGNLTKR
jgi:hypothetical protein